MTNNLIVKPLNFNEAFLKVIHENITSKFDLDEYKSVQYQDKAYNEHFPKCYEVKDFNLTFCNEETKAILLENGFVDYGPYNKSIIKVTINNEIFDIPVFTTSLNSFYGTKPQLETIPKIGNSIKRKSKAYPKGVVLTKEALKESEDFKLYNANISNNIKLLNQVKIANFLLRLTNSNFIDNDLYKSTILEKEYRKLKTEKEKIDFLKDNNFSGLENFDYEYKSSPDGYGHQNVSCKSIDFKNKEVIIIHGNSGD